MSDRASFTGTSLAIATLALACPASAETVTKYDELERDVSGYPCMLTMHTDEGTQLTVQLSDYQNVWSMNFFVNNSEAVLIDFYNEQNYFDDEEFLEAFPEIRIGDRSFKIHEASSYAFERDDLDAESQAKLGMNELHNVARALLAMKTDGINIPSLRTFDHTAEALAEFRVCSYEAMGLERDEAVETDYRAEYRMIFERAFERWVTQMAKAESCAMRGYDDDAIEEVVDRAASAFYPGLFNMFTRSEYEEVLLRRIPMYNFSGSAGAIAEGCFREGDLVDMGRIPVDAAMREAEEVE